MMTYHDSRSNRNHLISWSVVGAFLLFAVAGCTSKAASTAPTPTKAAPTLKDFMAAVQQANNDDNGGVSAGPQALAMTAGTGVVTQIKDVDQTAMRDGTYNLTVYCAGPGTVSIALLIGDAEGDGTLTCGTTVQASYVSVVGSGDSSTVIIKPTAGGPVAVAYRLKN